MGCNYSYVFTQMASKDIDNAIGYIPETLSNKVAAKKLFGKIKNTLSKVCNFPMSYPSCETYFIEDKNYRHAFIANYILIFRINEKMKQIEVLRFVYSGRDVSQINI